MSDRSDWRSNWVGLEVKLGRALLGLCRSNLVEFEVGLGLDLRSDWVGRLRLDRVGFEVGLGWIGGWTGLD